MVEQLRIRALGPPDITVGDRIVTDLIPAKGRALLVRLALGESPKGRSELAGLLWSDFDETAARGNLRLTLSRLRKVIPDHLEVSRGVVGLVVDSVSTDVGRLEELAHSQDVDRLDPRLPIYRCDFLGDFSIAGAALFDEWASRKREELRATALGLLDTIVAAARASTDTGRGIAAARRILELEPWHEEAHRALMWFFAAADQRSAALAQFETCRHVLSEELGVEPDATTVALADDIHRRGGFGIAPEPVPVGLASSLVGRDREFARLHGLLDDPSCRMVTIVGPGGIGKTVLARDLASMRASRHRSGAVTLSLVGTRAAHRENASPFVIAALASALGVSLSSERDPQELLAERLASEDMLLVLDNFEQVVSAAPVLVSILAAAPGVKMLVTSRRRVGAGPEWVFELGGLACPPPDAVADLDGYDAVKLFEARAQRLGGAASADQAAVGRITRLVEGVPLSIELAARWVRAATLEQIEQDLAGDIDLLATADPDVEPRHRSVRSVFEWSWSLLDPSQQASLARLSVLRGRFDAVTAIDAAHAGLAELAALVDHSLVQMDESGFYSLHEQLRQFASAKLATDPVADAETRRRHADHFRNRAARWAELSPDDKHGPTLDDLDNMRAATAWMIDNGEIGFLYGQIDAVWRVYRLRGWYREAVATFSAAVDRPDGTANFKARCHLLIAEAYRQIGDLAEAFEAAARALEVLGRRVPRTSAGWSARTLGETARQVGHRALLGQTVGGSEERRRSASLRAGALIVMGEIMNVMENQRLATAALWSLNEAERAGSAAELAQAATGIGFGMAVTGSHRLANWYAQRGLRAAETAGADAAAFSRMVASAFFWNEGQWEQARAVLPLAMEQGRQTGMRRLEDMSQLIFGFVTMHTGDVDDALAIARQIAESGRNRGHPGTRVWGAVSAVEWLIRAGRWEEAESCLGDATAAAAKAGQRVDTARVQAAAARIDLRHGDFEGAWAAIAGAEAALGGQAALVPWGLEAHASIAEVALELIGAGLPQGVTVTQAEQTVKRGQKMLRDFVKGVPIGRSRLHLVRGRHAAYRGRRQAALRWWVSAATEASSMDMPWDEALAHRQLADTLGVDERSALGLDRDGHKRRATDLLAAIGVASPEGDAQSGDPIGAGPEGAEPPG
jgi:predicted ATPase/DNA-binding SARP family transcriptional activator